LFQINLVKKVIDTRATVYRTKPTRTFEGMDQAAGEQLYTELAANLVLKRASRLTKLCKTTLLQVGWSGDRPTLYVLTPNVTDVEHEGDPQRPSRIIITHKGARPEDTTFSEWTATTFRKFDYRGRQITVDGNRTGLNPYGVLPFVPLFDYMPSDAFWLPGGDDLVEAQQAVNVALTNLWRCVELQSHGQGWASGLPASETLRAGPDRFITLPEGGQLGFAAPNSPISEVLEAIAFVIKQTAIANSLSPQIFETTSKAESGLARLLDNRDLMEAREDDLELWRVYEGRLWTVIRAVANTHRPGSIPEGATMRVDFGEMSATETAADQVKRMRELVALGVYSPVDCLLELNPDLSREDAMRLLAERRDEAATLGVQLAEPIFASGTP
jgi:hypothetical protein